MMFLFKRFIQAYILFLLAFGSLFSLNISAQTEPALYKKIMIQDTENFFIKGFVRVDFKQGQTESVELYIDADFINAFQIGIEKNNDINTFFIKDMTKPSKEKVEVKPSAHIIITVANLHTVNVHDVHRLNIEGFNAKALKLKATGYSNVYFSKNTMEDATFDFQHYSLLKAENNQINNTDVYLLSRAKVALSNFEGETLQVDLRDHTRLSTTNIALTSLHAFGSYRTQLLINEKSTVNSAYLSGNVDTFMDLRKADVTVLNANFFNNAKVNIGEVKVLNTNLRDDVELHYDGKPAMNNTIENNAVIAPYSTTQAD